MKSWMHTMLEDFKLLPKKPMWKASIMAMCEFAAGASLPHPRARMPSRSPHTLSQRLRAAHRGSRA
eukprot:5622997-Prymnesium_polylepis.1